MSEKNRICFDCGGAFTEEEAGAHSCTPKEPQPSQGAGAEEIGEEFFLRVIDEWQRFWMNQTQNSKQDHDNYFRRAIGVDANMRYNLADRLCKATAAGRASQDARIGELQKELHRLQDDLCEKVRSEGGRLEARAEAAEKRIAELERAKYGACPGHEAMLGKIRELEAHLKEARWQANEWRKAAQEWERDYDKLKNKYEPLVPTTGDA